MPPRTMFEKIWDAHVVVEEPGKPALLYVDLHLTHEITSAQAFEGLRLAGRKVRRPDLTYSTVDHNVPTTSRILPVEDPIARQQIETLERNTAEFGIRFAGRAGASDCSLHSSEGPDGARPQLILALAP